jgi:cyanophycinase
LAHAEILKKLKIGIPFGGTSAGLAILGDIIFSASNGPVSSEQILSNPLDQRITLTPSMFGIKTLKNILTDTHFVVRDRMGRLISFLANAYHSKNVSLQGLGVDENTVFMVNGNGAARVMGGGAVYLLRPTSAPVIEKNHLSWKQIGVIRWTNGSSFSLTKLPNSDYFYNVDDGKIISTKADGKIY